MKTKELCNGCYNDSYNFSQPNGCFSFKNAKVVKRMRVGVWQNPPYHWQPQTCLTCFRPENGVMIDKDDCRVEADHAVGCAEA